MQNFKMSFSAVFAFVMCSLVLVSCQQPLDDLSEISPYLPSENLEKSLLQQCESFAQALSDENERLKSEIKILKMKIQTMEEEEDEDEDEEEDEKDGGSYESEEVSRGLRSRRRRGAACDGGTLAAWACAPQCVFKLKGLCGLSLKSICHC